MKSVATRSLIYLVVISLAWLAIVPRSFEMLQAVRSGAISLRELMPWLPSAAGDALPGRVAAAKPKDVRIRDRGHGSYGLADFEWFGTRSGNELAQQLGDQAIRICAGGQGIPHVTGSSNFNSRGLNTADLEFWCEGSVAASDQDELNHLEQQLMELRVRIGEVIETLDERERKTARDRLGALGSDVHDVMRRVGADRLQGTRDMITRHGILLAELTALQRADRPPHATAAPSTGASASVPAP